MEPGHLERNIRILFVAIRGSSRRSASNHGVHMGILFTLALRICRCTNPNDRPARFVPLIRTRSGENFTFGAANCYDAFVKGVTNTGGTTGSGVFSIKPPASTSSYNIYCDQTTSGNGWNVIQRRAGTLALRSLSVTDVSCRCYRFLPVRRPRVRETPCTETGLATGMALGL